MTGVCTPNAIMRMTQYSPTITMQSTEHRTQLSTLGLLGEFGEAAHMHTHARVHTLTPAATYAHTTLRIGHACTHATYTHAQTLTHRIHKNIYTHRHTYICRHTHSHALTHTQHTPERQSRAWICWLDVVHERLHPALGPQSTWTPAPSLTPPTLSPDTTPR